MTVPIAVTSSGTAFFSAVVAVTGTAGPCPPPRPLPGAGVVATASPPEQPAAASAAPTRIEPTRGRKLLRIIRI